MITSEDRAKYSYYTDESILGIKLIGGLEDQVLLDIADSCGRIWVTDTDTRWRLNNYFLAIQTLMGEVNPNWIIAQVAEELYHRDLIDEQRLDELTR